MKNVLITGAGRGLGEALASCLLGRGERVFGLVRSPAAADAMRLLGPNAVPVIGDVTHAAVSTALQSVLRGYPEGLHLLVNNAGMGASTCSLQPGIEAEVAAHLDVHCIGALRVSLAALPFLRRAADALIVNVSSRFGSTSRAAAGLFAGRRLSYAYPIAKAAQNMLTLRLAEELRGTRIRVCAIHPGRMRTASGSADATDTPAEAAQRLARWLASPPQDLHGNFFELDTGRRGW